MEREPDGAGDPPRVLLVTANLITNENLRGFSSIRKLGREVASEGRGFDEIADAQLDVASSVLINS